MLFNAWIVVDALHKIEYEMECPEPVTKLHSALSVMAVVLSSNPAPPGKHTPRRQARQGLGRRASRVFRPCLRLARRT